jgi:hypothetical protein
MQDKAADDFEVKFTRAEGTPDSLKLAGIPTAPNAAQITDLEVPLVRQDGVYDALPVIGNTPDNLSPPPETFEVYGQGQLADIVRNLAVMVGFPKPLDPCGSGDPAVQQMVSAVNQAGADMMNLYDWQNVVKQGEIDIVADFPGQTQKAFDLPPDFWSFIDQTQWNKDTRLPAIGPVSPQAWMRLEVRNPKVVMSFMWQIRGDKLWIQSPPETPQRFVFMYISRGWIRDADIQTLYKNMGTKNGDYVLFDEYLVTLLSRVKWQQMKGFDATAAMADFRLNYENRKGRGKGAPVLNMSPRGGFPYIDIMRNTPDTGYGL